MIFYLCSYSDFLNKGCSSKFCVGSRVRQTPEEGRGIHRPERCGNKNKDESVYVLHLFLHRADQSETN